MATNFQNLPDIAGIFGTPPAEGGITPAVGFLPSGGKAIITIEQALQGMRQAHAQIQEKNYAALENEYRLAARQYEDTSKYLAEEMAKPTDQQNGALIAQLQQQRAQAYEQKTDAYGKLSGFFGEKKGKGKTDASGQPEPAETAKQKVGSFLKNLLLGPDPHITPPATRPIPGVTPTFPPNAGSQGPTMPPTAAT